MSEASSAPPAQTTPPADSDFPPVAPGATAADRAEGTPAWDRFWFTPAQCRVAAQMRMLAGVAAIVWFASWLPDASQWLTADGRLSVETARQLAPTPTAAALARPLAPRPVIWCGIAAATVLTVGLLTPLANAAALLCLLVIVHRGLLVQGPASVVLAMLLLYLLITPSGRLWSIDARGADLDRGSVRARVGWRLMQLHLGGLLLLSGLQQLGFSDVWWNGEASWWLIADSGRRLVDLTSVHSRPAAWQLATHLMAAYPLAAGLLVWRRPLRPWLLAAGCVYWPLLALLTGDLLYCGLMGGAVAVASQSDGNSSS